MANPELIYSSTVNPYMTTANLTSNLQSVSQTVPNDSVGKIVNLLVSYAYTLGDVTPAELELGVYDGSTKVADLITGHVLYSGDTMCLFDKQVPLILEEGHEIKAKVSPASTSGSSVSMYCAMEVYS